MTARSPAITSSSSGAAAVAPASAAPPPLPSLASRPATSAATLPVHAEPQLTSFAANAVAAAAVAPVHAASTAGLAGGGGATGHDGYGSGGYYEHYNPGIYSESGGPSSFVSASFPPVAHYGAGVHGVSAYPAYYGAPSLFYHGQAVGVGAAAGPSPAAAYYHYAPGLPVPLPSHLSTMGMQPMLAYGGFPAGSYAYAGMPPSAMPMHGYYATQQQQPLESFASPSHQTTFSPQHAGPMASSAFFGPGHAPWQPVPAMSPRHVPSLDSQQQQQSIRDGFRARQASRVESRAASERASRDGAVPSADDLAAFASLSVGPASKQYSNDARAGVQQGNDAQVDLRAVPWPTEPPYIVFMADLDEHMRDDLLLSFFHRNNVKGASIWPNNNSPSKSVPARRGHAKILLLTRKDYMASIKLNNHVLCEETDKQPLRLATIWHGRVSNLYKLGNKSMKLYVRFHEELNELQALETLKQFQPQPYSLRQFMRSQESSFFFVQYLSHVEAKSALRVLLAEMQREGAFIRHVAWAHATEKNAAGGL